MNSKDEPEQLKKWQVLQRDSMLDCPPWLSLSRETIQLPDGRVIRDYYQIEQRGYVEIVAWRDGLVYGMWGYRHGPRRICLGLPGGYLEPGEDPLAAARRELSEEAGLASADWQMRGAYCVDGNRSVARAHIFVAKNCRSVVAGASDDLEEKIGQWLTPQQWRENLTAGHVVTLGTAMAVQVGILTEAQ